MQLERPRFRQDLVAEPIEDGNAKFVDVADPDSNAVYRFYEVEYALACAMDGERDVAGVVRWAQEELGLSTTANEVKSVIATLGSLHFLDSEEAPVARPAAQQPAAAAREDEYLKPGVVVGDKRAQTPVPELELGHAGASAPAPAPIEAKADDIALGAGVTTGARAPVAPQAKADDIALGVPGRADVSVDLSEQVAVSPKDVKEAVRASKVMNAVELPDDLKNALDQAEKPTEKPAEKPAEKVAEKSGKQKRPPPTPAKGAPVVDATTQAAAEAKNAEAQKAADAAKAEAAKAEAEAAKAAAAAKAAEEAKTAAAAKAAEAAKAAAKPLPKPVEPKPEAKPAVAPPAPEQKVSRPLIIGLVVVVLAVIAFLVYKNVIAKHSTESTENTPPPQKQEPVKPPPPPAPESEKLATNAPASESIKPVSPGTLEMIAASDAKVKEGDPLVRFAGAKALDTEITAMEKDVDQRVKTELYKAQQERDAAIASGNKAAQTSLDAKVADRQKSLDDKQAKIVAKRADLEKLQIKSPANGTFTAKAKPGTKVTPTDELGMLVPRADAHRDVQESGSGGRSEVARDPRHQGWLEAVVHRDVRRCERHHDRMSRELRERGHRGDLRWRRYDAGTGDGLRCIRAGRPGVWFWVCCRRHGLGRWLGGRDLASAGSPGPRASSAPRSEGTCGRFGGGCDGAGRARARSGWFRPVSTLSSRG